jgi:hypothetical protein
LKKKTWVFVTLSAAAVLAVGFGLVLTGSDGGASDAIVSASKVNATETYAPGQAALRATINPETGDIDVGVMRAEGPLDPDTENALRRDTEGLKEVVHPDGSVSVNLQGRFQSVMVTHFDEDGNLIICTDDHEQTVETMDDSGTTHSNEKPQTPEVQ